MSHVIEIERVGTPEEKFICPPKALEVDIRSLAWGAAVRQYLRGLPYFVPVGYTDAATVKIEFHYPYGSKRRLRDDVELIDPILIGLEQVICMPYSFASWKNMRYCGSNRFFDPERKRACTKVIVDIEGDEIFHPSSFQGLIVLLKILEEVTGLQAKDAIILDSHCTKELSEFRFLFAYFMNKVGAHILGTRALNLHFSSFRRFQDGLLQFRSERIIAVDAALREAGFYRLAGYFPVL